MPGFEQIKIDTVLIKIKFHKFCFYLSFSWFRHNFLYYDEKPCVKTKTQELEIHKMADFVQSFSYDLLPQKIIEKLKIHLLDAIACAIGALNGVPVTYQRQTIKDLGGNPEAIFPLTGNRTAVDRSAQYLTALIRYVDYMDNFIAKHGTCHPSDNIGSLLAVCDWKNLSGKKFIEAMAVAYNVQCRMIEVEPSMDKGFDHTTQLGYSIAAGVSKALNFTKEQTAHAIALSGSTFNPLVVTRAPHTSQWKGLLSSHIALGAVNCCLMAEKGMTGPLDVFEGTGGYNEDFKIKNPPGWGEQRLDLFDKLVLKKYNAEIHTQTAIEAVLQLKQENKVNADNVKKIKVEIFMTAYDITGGGKYGPRKDVETKEEADHSLPYLLAVALLDGQVEPEQFLPEKIEDPRVQVLLKKVKVSLKFPLKKPKTLIEKIDPYTRCYPEKLLCKVKIILKKGRSIEKEIGEYRGFHTNPAGWKETENKFNKLARELPADRRIRIIAAIKDLENIPVRELTELIR
jgi:2-methylcitrate dehydratase